MNPKLFSNKEFMKLREEINNEIKRRGTYKWWDPLYPPQVGEDRTPPLTLPSEVPQEVITDKSYTINTPSQESLEETKNIHFPSIGDNPSNYKRQDSSAKVEVEEMKNFLIGLSKILDINLYYGRNEEAGLAFRDLENIKAAVEKAKASQLNVPLHESPIGGIKNDPNGGVMDQLNEHYPIQNHPIEYPKENGIYVMPSGERDGEQGVPSEDNFFDDYKPFNTNPGEVVDRSWQGEGPNRDQTVERIEEGLPSSKYGMNPRNPNPGREFRSRPVSGGTPGACNVACFVAGTLIETKNGPVPIETLQLGDLILTQSGEYHPVYNKFNRIEECVRMCINESFDLTVTKEHPFWVRKYKEDGIYEEPDWVEVADISPGDLVCTLKLDLGSKQVGLLNAYNEGWGAANKYKISASGLKGLYVDDFINRSIFEWNSEGLNKFLEGFTDNGGCSVNKDFIVSKDKKLIYHIATILKIIAIEFTIVTINVKYAKYYGIEFYGVCKTKSDVWKEVISINDVGQYTVYNISVDEDPTYYADGVLVHNCTGLCHFTCDSSCAESCTTTCWGRCSNACTNTCGNVCTGCTTMCRDTCKTRCEDTSGYACIKAGLIPGKGVHTCEGCSYSCRFYPNKSALCTDAACKMLCFNTCMNGCMQNCVGGCTDNASENTSYTNGIGRGCRNNCTINCIGLCHGVCVGYCVQSCFGCCKSSCADNCTWHCETQCGYGCANGCTDGCKNSCMDTSSSPKSCRQNCTGRCMISCDTNCVGAGCRSVCGIEGSSSCEANCRMSCVNASCTAMCSNACTNECTTCVNTCGFNCGKQCTDTCGCCCDDGCMNHCNMECQMDCTSHCMFSCSDACGGCSNLCYSCVGMCIGTCSVRCQYNCSNCTGNCSYWCDTSCNRACFGNCETHCISTCSGQCMTLLQSNTTASLNGVNITNPNYKTPENREDEMNALKLHKN